MVKKKGAFKKSTFTVIFDFTILKSIQDAYIFWTCP